LEFIFKIHVHCIPIAIIHFCVAAFQVSHIVIPVLFFVNWIAIQVLLKKIVFAWRLIVCVHLIFLKSHVFCWITFVEFRYVVQKMFRTIVFQIREIIVSLVVISFYHTSTVWIVIFVYTKLRLFSNNRQAALSF
jgi:hypothetical protein